MSDRNFISFAGDGSGVVYLTVGDAPAELLFAADVPGIREHNLGVVRKPSGTQISDLLKFSGVPRLRVSADVLDARGCDEDAFDFNHCENCELIVRELFAAKRYCGTIKGESKNIRAAVGHQHGHGSETDYSIGHFSDQGNGKTTGIRLRIRTPDESPVTVMVMSADKPVLENGSPDFTAPQDYKVTLLNQGWFYPVFNFVKDLLRFFRVKI